MSNDSSRSLLRSMKRAGLCWLAVCTLSVIARGAVEPDSELRAGEWTSFQTATPWDATIDIRSDLAIVYGVNSSLPARVQSWREQGYRVALMTGVAWGGYQDYIEGRFDGRRHDDEGQVAQDGTRIMHDPTVPYMVPTQAYIEYLKSLVRQAIDAGVDAIFLEEPEFWARAGYSEGFKREWQAFYGEPWQAPASSPEATYRSQQLKYHLYLRALDAIFADAKAYTRQQRGPDAEMPCLVPTHSLINYTNWGIISPESLLAHSPNVDGYIAQVWTGTARTPNLYEGVTAERTFESALLEYGQMAAMTRPTGRRVYFLTDPIEDNPRYTWENYRENYHETFIAQLLYPEVFSYEVVPWPDRVFRGLYPSEGSPERVRIPQSYATELMVLFNALAEMHAAEPVLWHLGADAGIGVALSDTMMFQREPRVEDPHLSNLFGMAMPWVKRGFGVRLVQLENVEEPGVFEGIQLLLTSFSFMKCKREVELQRIVEWVREEGGVCVLFDDRRDAFNEIREWWNEGQAPHAMTGPAARLIELFKVGDQPGIYACGKGVFAWEPRDPILFASARNGADELIGIAAAAARKAGLPQDLEAIRPAFDLKRGMYRVVAAPDESPASAPYRMEGPYIDLFDPELPIRVDPVIPRGGVGFYLDLSAHRRQAPLEVLASSLRVERAVDVRPGADEVEGLRLHLRGPSRVRGILRLAAAIPPVAVEWTGEGESPVQLSVPEVDPYGTIAVTLPKDSAAKEAEAWSGVLTIFWKQEP
ncbi:MAG: hypothetical protein PHG55_11020 [Verrucomicrobiota bacterium]|nr:hypothetical protein [Verrucomicrobiota bacterium]